MNPRASLTQETTVWFLFQGLIIFAVVASNIHWKWTPNRYIPALLGIGLAEEVERIREQWSLELVDYDHAGNNDESKDNSC